MSCESPLSGLAWDFDRWKKSVHSLFLPLDRIEWHPLGASPENTQKKRSVFLLFSIKICPGCGMVLQLCHLPLLLPRLPVTGESWPHKLPSVLLCFLLLWQIKAVAQKPLGKSCTSGSQSSPEGRQGWNSGQNHGETLRSAPLGLPRLT